MHKAIMAAAAGLANPITGRRVFRLRLVQQAEG
jgi:hypothetical protein